MVLIIEISIDIVLVRCVREVCAAEKDIIIDTIIFGINSLRRRQSIKDGVMRAISLTISGSCYWVVGEVSIVELVQGHVIGGTVQPICGLFVTFGGQKLTLA